MARLPRLVVAGQAHYVIQRGQGAATPVFTDAADRADFIATLRQAAAAEHVLVHAYALLDAEVQLLVTPEETPTLGRMMQALGRRYVSTYNRRHGRRGTLWDGRFRAAVVEPGALRLLALRLVDGLQADGGVTSAGHRLGGPRDPMIVDPPEIWQLGNTPFEREAAYRELLAQGLPAGTTQILRHAALGGWAAGSNTFAGQVAATAARPARPRARGRPPRPLPQR